MAKENDRKAPRSVPIEEVDLEALKRNAHDNKALAEYASEKGSAVINTIDTGLIKNRSHAAMVQQIDLQMSQIKEQIQLLASQVERLQKRKDISEMVYSATMSFEPLVGHKYYLYDNKGEKRLMMISPDEWGKNKSDWIFIAEVELLADRTWDVLEVKGEEE